jgi:hypothetical protein
MSLWYLTGTVTLTSGSNDVTGMGSAWLANAKARDIFYTPSGGMYEILSVSADNALRLVTPYSGPSMTGVPYAIVSTQGFNVSLAMAMTELIPELAQIRDAYAAGADPAAAAALAAESANAAAAAAVTAASQAASAGGGSAINDAAIAANSTWSSIKTNNLIAAAKTAVKNDLTSGAASALDTLNELAQALNNDPTFAATITGALGKRLRIDTATQGLSPAERANALANLGITDVGSSTPDLDSQRTSAFSLITSISAYLRTQTLLMGAQ